MIMALGLREAAGSTGNILEWYDFAIYAYLLPAGSIALRFIPVSPAKDATMPGRHRIGAEDRRPRAHM
jgi:hypothetical protein